MKNIHIAPNKPLFVALVDPTGEWDDDLRQSRYQTTTGEVLTLPRPAVVALNIVEPKPGEEITITKLWSGKAGETYEWTLALSTRSEHARAAQEMGQEPPEAPERSDSTPEPNEPPQASVTPIRRAAKRATQPEPAQPRLFDQRGTGTDGPAPAPDPVRALIPAALLAPARQQKPGPIPWNVAFREVSAFVAAELKANNLQWSDASQQGMVSTVLIAASKVGIVGVWERGQ